MQQRVTEANWADEVEAEENQVRARYDAERALKFPVETRRPLEPERQIQHAYNKYTADEPDWRSHQQNDPHVQRYMQQHVLPPPRPQEHQLPNREIVQPHFAPPPPLPRPVAPTAQVDNQRWKMDLNEIHRPSTTAPADGNAGSIKLLTRPQTSHALPDEFVAQLQESVRSVCLEVTQQYYQQVYNILNTWLDSLGERLSAGVSAGVSQALNASLPAALAGQATQVSAQVNSSVGLALQTQLMPLQSQVSQVQQMLGVQMNLVAARMAAPTPQTAGGNTVTPTSQAGMAGNRAAQSHHGSAYSAGSRGSMGHGGIVDDHDGSDDNSPGKLRRPPKVKAGHQIYRPRVRRTDSASGEEDEEYEPEMVAYGPSPVLDGVPGAGPGYRVPMPPARPRDPGPPPPSGPPGPRRDNSRMDGDIPPGAFISNRH